MMENKEETRQFLEKALELSTDAYWPAAHPALETLQCYLAQPGWLIARDPTRPYHQVLMACLQRLCEWFPDPERRGQLVAEAYFRVSSTPARSTLAQETVEQVQQVLTMMSTRDIYTLHQAVEVIRQEQLFLSAREREQIDYSDVEHSPVQSQQRPRGLRLLRLLNASLELNPPADLVQRARAFLEEYGVFDEARRDTHTLSSSRWQDCLHLLLGQPTTPPLLSLLADLRQVELRHLDPLGLRHYDGETLLFDLVHSVFTSNLLSYEFFRHAAFLRPTCFMKTSWRIEGEQALCQRLEVYQDRLVEEVAQRLNLENYPILLAYERPLSGSAWLLAAARACECTRPKELVGVAGPYSPITYEQAIIRLARAKGVECSETHARSELVAQLRNFRPSTLKALLGVAVHARGLLCEALGWQAALPLITLVESLAAPVFDEPDTNLPDTDVLDVARVRGVLAAIDAELAEEVLALLVRGKSGVEDAATLVRAVGGWNRTSVLKGIKHNGHIALKAYGLLPLTHGNDEVMERYLELQRQTRIGQHFGAGRRANFAQAIDTAKAHLAQVGGYRDAAHLEWEMEAAMARETLETEAAWTVGAYTVQIALAETQAVIQVMRSGKSLRSVPQNVRASAVYKKDIKDALARMRMHISRMKKGLLERLLTTGEPLSPEELAHLLETLTVRALLSKLVWRPVDGALGLLDPTRLALCGLDGQQHVITGPVAVAHPLHLFQADALATWQRFFIQQRIVQPVKQVFRELYVLTPAEQQAVTSSARFAEYPLNGSIALRLLADRNWRVPGRHAPHLLAYRTIGGLRASFELSHNGHYLGEPGSEAVTGTIFFERLPYTYSADRLVPLVEVPPLLFSEVMRDIDLVVSVAQVPASDRQFYQSAEIASRTGEIVRVLLDELHLSGVTIAGHFAFVQGKLARYRVHLSSATIHIEPGHYLCIIPAHWGNTHEQLFLPFADDDTRTSEVISKILLLLADDQIKDESVLRQIKRTK